MNAIENIVMTEVSLDTGRIILMRQNLNLNGG